MTEALARLYLAAARNDPFVAAWIRILDEHQLPARAEIAPVDWQESFADLFVLDLVSAGLFNAVDFTHHQIELTPSTRDVDRALARLVDLRAETEPKEHTMAKFDPFSDPQTLALAAPAARELLSREDALRPLSPLATAPFELLAKPAPPVAAPLAPSRPPALGDLPLAAARRALGPGAGQSSHRVADKNDQGEPESPDPRTRVPNFEIRLYCCGLEVDLTYEGGERVEPCEGAEAGDAGEVLVEFAFYGSCQHCKGHKYFHESRPLPANSAW